MDASQFLGPVAALAISLAGIVVVWRRLEKADLERLARETADRAERLARETAEREDRHARESEWRGIVQANTQAMQAMTSAAETMAAEMRALLGTRDGDRGAQRREVSQPNINTGR